MRPTDRERFRDTIAGAYSFYGRELTKFQLGVWWAALEQFDFEAVADAISRHLTNPDAGQFLPKPADVVKLLSGSTQDAAIVAWTKALRAVQRAGTYVSVAFDDPLIHRVLDDMGGWVEFGKKKADEEPFVAREFQQRYRAYATQQRMPDYPPRLMGVIEAENSRFGLPGDEHVMLIGDERRALESIRGGTAKPLLPMNRLDVASALPPRPMARTPRKIGVTHGE
jgi:hypothetical protein